MIGCENCHTVKHYCEVCKIMENDTTIKDVVFCEHCGVYICRKHLHSWARIKAAFIAEKENPKLKWNLQQIVKTGVKIVKKVSKKKPVK